MLRPSTSITRGSAILTAGIVLVLLSFPVCPAAARTTIQGIQPGDMIFVYEEHLDLTGLRTGGNTITSLRKYQDDSPTRGAVLREIPVPDDTNFSPVPEAFGNLLGIYYAWNQTGGAMNSVVVRSPSVSIDAVLASPNHSDSIKGLTIPEDTAIAFKIVSTDVGAFYHAGALYPATVDLVLTAPGGAQLTTIGGKDFSKMNVSAQVFYTDDPGRPGTITLQGLGTGTFSVQAKWSTPPSFDAQAPDSNALTFVIGKRVAVGTTPVPVTTAITTRTTTTTPARVTTAETTPPPPPTTPATTAHTPTLPATTAAPPTGTTAPSPTSMPAGAWPALFAPVLALLPRLRGRQG